MKKKLFFVFIFSMLISALFLCESALAADTHITSGTGGVYINLSSSAYSDGDTLYIETSDLVELTGGAGKNLKIVTVTSENNIVLSNVDIRSEYFGIYLSGMGITRISILGSNYISSGTMYPGIRVPFGTELHISGTGTLEVHGDTCSPAIGNDGTDPYDTGQIVIDGGTIYAYGGESAAGIGSAYMKGTAHVEINGGNVYAYGGSTMEGYSGIGGAGIGGGAGGDVEGISTACNAYIEINGGNVEAHGGENAAGIGGGSFGGVGIIYINGGRVEGYGGEYAAGIGGGYGWDYNGESSGYGYGAVYITNAEVYAEGGYGGAGIGGGQTGDGYVVVVNSSVSGIGGLTAAGIGGGQAGNGEVYIYSGTVFGGGGANDTDGSEYWYGGGAGIGSGGDIEDYYFETRTGKVVIFGGTITAEGGSYGAGIGGGYNGFADVEIYGGITNAAGAEGGAGIGGGYEGDANIEIYSGTITAQASEDSAGIGGGAYGYADISIYGGHVETIAAYGSEAGIGSGYSSTVDYTTINITGGLIIARGGTQGSETAAGIGGGWDSDVDYITITGGQVYAIGAGTGSDDIGTGTNGTGGTVTIDGSSAVFLMRDTAAGFGGTLLIGPSHMHVDSETVTGNEAYGFTEFPNDFNTRIGYGYIRAVTVYYNHNWGTAPTVDEFNTYAGILLEAPTPPVRDGYVFNGWHLDDMGVTPVIFGSMPAYDGLTIYADWVDEGTFTGNITGILTENSGVPVEGAYITLMSAPITVTTGTGGTFAYGSVFYIGHTLLIRDSSGTIIDGYTLTFTPGSVASAVVDETMGTISIVYTPSTTGVNIPLRLDAYGSSIDVYGVITFTYAGTDPVTGRAINPNTGDSGMSGFVIAGILAMGLAATAAIAANRRKRKTAESID